ncbi:hypothetical protein GX51_00976 [Blastomyces parvus]|uniref:Uncharacterized protein n=1 Tax=Blastomyces parvus TaxID=2060905 RepID=A0A2B7XJ36_9EURO|nr:hypothetical protein GX51_00976 [Blastomyces parvus]
MVRPDPAATTSLRFPRRPELRRHRRPRLLRRARIPDHPLGGRLRSLPPTPGSLGTAPGPELCFDTVTVTVVGCKASERLWQPATRVLAMKDRMSIVFRGSSTLKEYIRLSEVYIMSLSELDIGEQGGGVQLVLSLGERAGLISSGLTILTGVRAIKPRPMDLFWLYSRLCWIAGPLRKPLKSISVQVTPLISIGAFDMGGDILIQIVRLLLEPLMSDMVQWQSLFVRRLRQCPQ